MKILVIRGYKSESFFEHTLDINGTKAHLTVEPIGKPVLVKKKLMSILTKYDLDEFDYIYTISMSSCLTSIIDKKHFHKVCMVTPFYLHLRSIFILSKTNIKKWFGCYLLILLNGRMGRLDKSLRLILAELDDVTDNKYFQKKFDSFDVIDGVDHYLGEDGAIKIIENDLVTRY